jgi:hypothetical protein
VNESKRRNQSERSLQQAAKRVAVLSDVQERAALSSARRRLTFPGGRGYLTFPLMLFRCFVIHSGISQPAHWEIMARSSTHYRSAFSTIHPERQ